MHSSYSIKVLLNNGKSRVFACRTHFYMYICTSKHMSHTAAAAAASEHSLPFANRCNLHTIRGERRDVFDQL